LFFYLISLSIPAYLSFCNSGAASNDNTLPGDSITLAKGEKSFVTNCSNCHNFYHTSIGPQLAGITSENSITWIKNFIKDPNKVIQSGDERAQRLFKKYKVIMPSFASLPDQEINAIIAYIDTKKKQDKKVAAEDTNDIKNPIPDSIMSSDLVVDLQFLTKIPASSDKTPFTRIIKLGFQPDKDDLFILDLRGKLYKLVNGQPVTYMDMAALKPNFIHQPGLATGFGSFAFHPQFSKNGLLYTSHTEEGSVKADFNYPDSIPVKMQWVVTEWKTNPSAFPFSGKPRELFRVNVPSQIHGMQELAFNRLAKPGDQDYGLLYIGIGDGGSVEMGHALVSEIPNKIWGSIIRIDPLGKNSKNGKYGIPRTNPFAKPNKENYAPEVYAYGFRNPHRFSWSKTGQMIGTNIGQTNIEAVYLIRPGSFYGWPIREGTFLERFFDATGKVYELPSDDSTYHITYPVAQYDHDDGVAISGGFEYTGSAVPQLAGKYLFGDIPSGKLFYVNVKDLKQGKLAAIRKWNIVLDGKPTDLTTLTKSNRVDLRFGMDRKGELYVLTKADGKVYKIVKAKGGGK
jgi:glucose/arabinose dehydrogenase/cytochrome c2